MRPVEDIDPKTQQYYYRPANEMDLLRSINWRLLCCGFLLLGIFLAQAASCSQLVSLTRPPL